VRLVLLGVATLFLAAVPAHGGSGRLTAAKAERLAERKASIRYDGAVVEADCHRTRRGYACTYAVTADGCSVGTRGTATVVRRRGGRVTVTLHETVSSFCDSG
jgi:hypothetical protein